MLLLTKTKQQVINILNESNLPIDAIYYVMKEVMTDVERTYNEVFQEEKANEERPINAEEAKKLNEQYAKEENNKEEEKGE